MQRLAERRHVRIILHENREPRLLRQPFAEGEIVPSFDMVRALDAPGFPIHRPAIAHADRLWLPARNQCWQRFRNLRPDALAARRPVHKKSAPLQDRSLRIARKDLELRAADFDGDEIHIRGMPEKPRSGNSLRHKLHRLAPVAPAACHVLVPDAGAVGVGGFADGLRDVDLWDECGRFGALPDGF